MNKHTPGSWTAVCGDKWPWKFTIKSDTAEIVVMEPWAWGSDDKSAAEVYARDGMEHYEANAHLIAAAPTMYEELQQEIEVLERLAKRCDVWAMESKQNGWSTHQVEANRATADECRRRASGIRETIAKAEGS